METGGTDDTIASVTALDRGSVPEPEPAAESQTLERGQSVGRYIVLDTLGAGGMGVVHSAYDPELDRRIALKLLRTDRRGGKPETEGRSRLMREAQAMAKLSHPNVIPVHDVGVVDGQVFIAMELVDGVTLKAWMAEGPPWTEVLRVFLEAARGLLAAHDVGLVHRDFKPDNVLLGQDGRVRVMDFGLARPSVDSDPDDEAWAEAGAPEAIARARSEPNALDTPLTQTGAIMGTPAYMAPEQHAGLPTDPRTDQFSFCVALYEALYGERPFRGETFAALAFNVTQGEVVDAPKGSSVPNWVRQLVLRGLKPHPGERYTDLRPLIDGLSHDPAQRRRRIYTMAGLGLTAILAAGVAYAARDDATAPTSSPEVCTGAAERFAEAWSPRDRASAEQAFAATGVSFAAHTWTRVDADLRAYERAWVSTHQSACEATRVRGDQSEEVMDLRMACLAQGLAQVRALGKLFASADAAVVEHAIVATKALDDPHGCMDLDLLTARVPPPDDPQQRAQVATLREQLAEVDATALAGRYEDALARARALNAEAEALEYRPLVAETQLRIGSILRGQGRYDEAEIALLEASWLAEEGQHHEAAADAWLRTMWVVGVDQRDLDAVESWARAARAAVGRLDGTRPDLEALLVHHEAGVALARNERAVAIEGFAAALRAQERIDPRSPDVAGTHNHLANAYLAARKYAEARTHATASFELRRELLGERHPLVAAALTNVASSNRLLGEKQLAVEQMEKSLDIVGDREDTVAADAWRAAHRAYEATEDFAAAAHALHELDRVRIAQGRPPRYTENDPRLVEHLRTYAESQAGKGIAEARAVFRLAVAERKAELHRDALTHAQRADILFREFVEPDDILLAQTQYAIGFSREKLGQLEEALGSYMEASRIRRSHSKTRHAYLAFSLAGSGRCLLKLGRPGQALPLLREAVAIREALGVRPAVAADSRFRLAVALWETGHDKAEARALAEDALASHRKGAVRLRGHVQTWLDAHPLPDAPDPE